MLVVYVADSLNRWYSRTMPGILCPDATQARLHTIQRGLDQGHSQQTTTTKILAVKTFIHSS